MNVDINYVMSYSQEELLKNNSSIINKLKLTFDDKNKQFFNSHLCLHINYENNEDFIIKLDQVWKWIGFSRVEQSKTLLFKNFIENTDYIQEIREDKISVLITIKCFKQLCLLAKSQTSIDMKNYYLEIEKLLFNLVKDETQELTKALTVKKKKINISSFLNKKIFFIIIIKEQKNLIEEIIFGRTALEIKSSIGAKPVMMSGFIFHSNKLINRYIGKIFEKLEPPIEWQQRHPFK